METHSGSIIESEEKDVPDPLLTPLSSFFRITKKFGGSELFYFFEVLMI